MSEFFAALAGAIVGALAALAGQWYVTPRLDRQVRAEQRWEEDALGLLRLLNEELPSATRSLKHALDFLSMVEDDLAENPDAPNHEFILQLRERVKDEARDARTAWRYLTGDRLSVLIEWLDLGRLVISRRLELAAIQLPDPISGIGDTSDEGMASGWEALEEARKAFAAEVAVLTAPLVQKPG